MSRGQRRHRAGGVAPRPDPRRARTGQGASRVLAAGAIVGQATPSKLGGLSGCIGGWLGRLRWVGRLRWGGGRGWPPLCAWFATTIYKAHFLSLAVPNKFADCAVGNAVTI
jgi:hypothetical protein